MTLKQLECIRRNITQQRIIGMKLAGQPYHLILGGGIVSQMFNGPIPDLLKRSLAVHLRENIINGGTESVITSARVVLKNKPYFSTVMVAVNLCMAA
jgi:hypothetical protein